MKFFPKGLTPEATAFALALATLSVKSVMEEPSTADAPALVRLMFAVTAPTITALSGAGCGVINAMFGYRRKHRKTPEHERPDFIAFALKQAFVGGTIGLIFGLTLLLAKPALPSLSPVSTHPEDPSPASLRPFHQHIKPNSLLPRGS